MEIFLPTFKLESSFDLSATLANMGMSSAFGQEADFSGMEGTKLLYISGVFHKTWAEVNEEGTAAASAVVEVLESMTWSSAPPAPVFRARPPIHFLHS